METHTRIVLPDMYKIPVLTNQYQITSTGTNEEGGIPFVLYLIIGRTVSIVYGQQLSAEANMKIMAQLTEGVADFAREERRKQIESERDLANIHLNY